MTCSRHIGHQVAARASLTVSGANAPLIHQPDKCHSDVNVLFEELIEHLV